MSNYVTPSKMSGKATKRSHPNNGITFPNGLEIPESAQLDTKYLTSYVRIYNDPRLYKRQRCGDRTSSRFDAYLDSNINVVYNEPIIKRKSILLNPENSKEKSTHDHSGTRKSVSFSAKLTVIDIDLEEGGSSSSNCSDDDFVESEKSTKIKSKRKDETKEKNVKKEINIDPAAKNHVNKTKNKSPNKNGHKNKSPPKTKELFKFKITKPVRKCGRSKLKGKKLKSLQKKFGSRMFNSRVVIRRKNLSEFLSLPLEVLSLPSEEMNVDEIDLNTNEIIVVSDDVINKMTKKLKVVLTPVKMVSFDISEVNIKQEPVESDISVENTSISEINDIRIDGNQIDMNGTTENVKMQNIVESSDERVSPVAVSKIKGESANLTNCDSVMTHQPQTNNILRPKFMTSNSPPNIFDKITCNMFYNTNEEETATTNGHGQILNTDNDHHIDLVDNSSLNVSFSLKDNILCDASEIAFT